jgi:SAM-dependent methyltransferase
MIHDSLSRSLTDPATIGEDLTYNCERVVGYARAHCGACIDYHMTWPIRRAFGRIGTTTGDRDELIAMVGTLIRERAEATAGPIDVVVAGTADTQIPAVCAHAALMQGAGTFARLRLTVIDRCETPLRLCRDFAARHGLHITFRVADFVTTGDIFPADILMCHSLFNFIAREHHDRVLKKFGGWLKPGGRIVFRVALRPDTLRSGLGRRADQAAALILSALESGALTISEPRAAFEARLDWSKLRVADFGEPAEVYGLFARCGLAVHVGKTISGLMGMPTDGALRRDRVMAALGRAP